MVATDLAADHRALRDPRLVRRYFAKLERVMDALQPSIDELVATGDLRAREGDLAKLAVQTIRRSVEALALRYMIACRMPGIRASFPVIDAQDSGFPTYQEIATLSIDRAQAAQHLDAMMSETALMDRMLRVILNDKEHPRDLQFAMAQRAYYETLKAGGLWWPQMHPKIAALECRAEGRRRYQLSWGVYDTRLNVPVIYLMEIEDSGRRPLEHDDRRWPAAQDALIHQSIDQLKLVTIASGFDRDFPDLHPKRLVRIHVGPLYSSAFTVQNGPIKDVLESARAPEGEDWALAWTIERLESERVEFERVMLGRVDREIFALDPLTPEGSERGVTALTRSLIMPERPFQSLVEMDPAGFKGMRKFVVGHEGHMTAIR